MATGRPFFPGSTVEDQLHLIFKVSETQTISARIGKLFGHEVLKKKYCFDEKNAYTVIY